MALDLNLLPLYRLNGQEMASLPGLLAATPPRKTARGRERDSLIVYLVLSGNATFSADEFMQLTHNAAGKFYQSAGSLTSAMRLAADSVNQDLLQRNLSTTGRGQYALGWLTLAVIRENQCTLLLSGPMHAFAVTAGEVLHIHDPALSGKGLGVNQSINHYYSQVELKANDRLALCGRLPAGWEEALRDHAPVSLEATRRKLLMSGGDLNAVLIQVQEGRGNITVLRPEVTTHPAQPVAVSVSAEPAAPPTVPISGPEPEPPPSEETEARPSLDELAAMGAHMVQPSAYAIPPQPETPILTPPMEAPAGRVFPPSIPRAKPVEAPALVEAEPEPEPEPTAVEREPKAASRRDEPKPTPHAVAARQIAKTVAGGIQTGRRVNERLGAFFQKFLPRLLPGTESAETLAVPTYAMVFIAVAIPLLVVTIASIVYLRYGQSVQFDEYFRQAQNARIKAVSAGTPTGQRDAWLEVIHNLDQAEKYDKTSDTQTLRNEAQNSLDVLMGVTRLDFARAFPNDLGTAQITRLAASESDLYMLDAERGDILHAAFTGRGLELDNTFNCRPGSYGGYQVNALVDIVALPKANSANASVMGIDGNGTLLYCAPGQVPQAFALPPLPSTNWGRVTSIVLDSNWLYILDAPERAVWLFPNSDSTFLRLPTFFFNEQIPNIEDAIDMSVSNDDLYLLHADGHLTTCSFSSNPDVPTRCNDSVNFVDPFPAHDGLNLFSQAHFTQMQFTSPPDQAVLLLDADGQGVFRFTPRSLELQNQFQARAGDANRFTQNPLSAMTVSPNHVLYLAIGNQVYFATNLP